MALDGSRCSSLQLQSLHFGSGSCRRDALDFPSAVLKHVPALTGLLFGLAPRLNRQHKQLQALCSLTALRSLHLVQTFRHREREALVQAADEALAPLSTLQQLTALHLPEVTPQQLSLLKQPGLMNLDARLARAPKQQQQQQQGGGQQEPAQQVLQLGHMTSLTRLVVRSESLLLPDTLPLSLRAVRWALEPVQSGQALEEHYSMQPLLRLNSLEQLDLVLRQHVPTVAHLRQLATLPLKAVKLNYGYLPAATQTAADGQAHLEAGTEEAWAALPLTQLRIDAYPTFVDAVPAPFRGVVALSSAAAQAISSMRFLTWLDLSGGELRDARQNASGQDGTECHLKLDITPGQLSAVLQGLTALERFHLSGELACDLEVAGHSGQ
jgi:hypothetical protein